MKVILHYLEENGLWMPRIICENCGHFIEENGNVIWFQYTSENFAVDEIVPQVACKGVCSQAVEERIKRQNKGILVLMVELDTCLYNLLHNSCVDIEKAKLKSDILASYNWR